MAPIELQKSLRIERIISHLQQEPLAATDTCGRDLAELVELSARELAATFRLVTGKTLRQYLRAMRMKHAATMLLHTSARVKEVAYSSGYSAPSNFVRDFRGEFGVSPGRFRNMSTDHREDGNQFFTPIQKCNKLTEK
jgi:AraC-like DNA-binding protein